jgi:anti-sigma factor RsiW
VSKYRQLVNRFSNVVVSEAGLPGPECPKEKDVDWHEVAAGLWPDLKTTQLITHAADCEHCGPLLHAAASLHCDPTRQEEELLGELKALARPAMKEDRGSISVDRLPIPAWQRFLRWKLLVPAVALMMIAVSLGTRMLVQSAISGSELAELAVSVHRQHAQGKLALDVRSDSQQKLNEWFRAKSQFSLALPASPAAPGEERPYRLEGARLLQVGGKTAVYIAYQMQTSPVSLMVTPDSVAVASGGVTVDFKNVSFHYSMVEGYKVVTWSVHGLTYALVSQEGNSTQRSCMVCHSAMKDRDLTNTPTPLRVEGNTVVPIRQ